MPYQFLVIYVVSLLISLGVNRYLLKRYAKWGVKNHTDEGQDRWVSITKPSVGGIGFFVMFLLAIGFALFHYTIDFLPIKIIGFIAATIVGFLTGIIDDRNGMPPWFKFAGQFLCGVILCASGVYIEMNSYWICNYLLTIFWVVGVMNSINMLDNMDGITAITSYFIMLSFIVSYFSSGIFGVGNPILIAFTVILLGGLSGFLKYNWATAKMYMGDSGSQFLGAFLAALSIIFLWNFKDPEYGDNFIQYRQFALPLIVFVVPIIDTTTVFVRRMARGQSPFVGGRDHTTHQLAIAGLKDGQVGLVFMFINAVSLFIVYQLLPEINNWTTTYTLGAFAYFMVLLIGFQLVYWWNGRK